MMHDTSKILLWAIIFTSVVSIMYMFGKGLDGMYKQIEALRQKEYERMLELKASGCDAWTDPDRAYTIWKYSCKGDRVQDETE